MKGKPTKPARPDDTIWLDLFEPLFFGCDTGVADKTAKLFDYLLVELDSGPEGVTNVGVCIENALRLIFPFTAMGRACMVLFQVSLGKDFPAQPDTLAALSEAMKRTRAALVLGPVRERKRGEGSRRK